MSLEDEGNDGPVAAGKLPREFWWWGFGICLVAIACYAQVWDHTFCGYDEPMFLINNSMVNRGLTWDGACWAMTTHYDFNYNPIPWFSHMLDVSLFGLNQAHAGPQKLMSLFYHLLAMWALLLFLVKATGSVWRSGVVAALFTLHPLHVEPVVFVIARKDVLAALFGFLTMLAYLHYVRRRSIARYSVVATLLVAALLSKATMITLPFVLILLDIWPLRRWGRAASACSDVEAETLHLPARSLKWLVLEKLPLLVFSLVTGLVAIGARQGSLDSLEALSVSTRIENAIVNYTRYLGKMFWPVDLCYFFGITSWSPWQVAGSLAILMVITALAILICKRRPWVLMGWLFYLGTMVTVIGLMQAGPQSIADRYTYFPLTGLFIAMVWSIPDAWVATKGRLRMLSVFGVFLIASLAAATYRQVGFWRDNMTLYLHAQEVDPDTTNLVNLSGELIALGRIDEARQYTTRLLKARPTFAFGYAAHGAVLERKGLHAEAESVYRHGIEIRPRQTMCRLQLAKLLLAQGKSDEGIAALETNVGLSPNRPEGYRELAEALSALGRNEQAIGVLRKVLELDPYDVKSMSNLGACYDRLGRPKDALAPLEHAVSLRPGYADARENLGAIYAQLGRIDDATRQYEWMVRQSNQKPEWLATAYHRLGLLRSRAGRSSEAVACLRKAAELTPMDAEVHNDLGVALAQQHDIAGAIKEFSTTLKADPNHADAKKNLARAQGMLDVTTPTSRP